MIEANYPGLMDERIKIKFMLKEIKKHSVFQQVAIQGLINLKSVITDMENMFVLVHSVIGATRADTDINRDYRIWTTVNQHQAMQKQPIPLYTTKTTKCKRPESTVGIMLSRVV